MLVGEKIILEEIDRENIEQLRQWRNDPSLRQWFREYKDITKDKQEAWYNERGNNTNPAHVYFQIMSLGTGENKEEQVQNRYLIGCCGLHYLDFRSKIGELGIFIAKDRGQGKGKESLVLLFDYGFNELNLNKIWAEVYKGNDSINLYSKFMTYEGELRDSHFHNGKYNNSIIMSVLQREWAHKRNS